MLKKKEKVEGLKHFTYVATEEKLVIDWEGKAKGNEVIFVAQTFKKSKEAGHIRKVLYTRAIQDGKRPIVVESKPVSSYQSESLPDGYLIRIREASFEPVDITVKKKDSGKIVLKKVG